MFQVDQCSDKNYKTFQQREMKINVTLMGGVIIREIKLRQEFKIEHDKTPQRLGQITPGNYIDKVGPSHQQKKKLKAFVMVNAGIPTTSTETID